MTQYTQYYLSPLGKILIASTDTAITGLWFEGQKHFGSTLADGWEGKAKALPSPRVAVLDETVEWLNDYFAGQQPTFTPPLHLIGTPFQQQVWQYLTTIPYGAVTTYGKIAKAVGIRSARAVGAVVGRNPITLIIPCHRVIGAAGKLTGYAGGLHRKQALLTLERMKNEK